MNSVSLCAACKRKDISSSLIWFIFSWAFDVWFAFCSESLKEAPKTIPLTKNSKKDRKAMSWTQLWSLSRDPCTLKPNKRIKSSFEPGFRTNKKNNLQLQRAGSSAGAHHCYSSLPVNRSFNCLRYPRWLQLLQPVCSFGLFIDIKLDDICFTTINQTMGMLINNEKQSLMDSPLCEHIVPDF